MIRIRTRTVLLLLVAIGALWGAVAVGFPIIDPGSGAVQGSGYPAFGADTTVSVSTSSARVSLSAGLYAISCPVVVYADQATAESVVATTSERRIPANYVYPLRTDAEYGTWLALIAGESSTCVISKDGYR